MNENLPPASFELEIAVLGCIIFDPAAISKIYDWLPVEAFFISEYRTIYIAARNLYENGKTIDFIGLSTYLSDQNQLEQVGGTTNLAHMLNQTVSSTNVDRYAKGVLDKYRRRQLIAIGHQIVEAGYDQTIELSEHYQKIRELLPESITGAAPIVAEPIVTKAKYKVVSKSCGHELELEADIKDNWNLEDSIANLAAKTKLIGESLWMEEIK